MGCCHHCHKHETECENKNISENTEKESERYEIGESVKKILFITGVVLFVIGIALKFLLSRLTFVGDIVFILAYIFLGFDVFCDLIGDLREHEFFSESMLMTVSSLGAMFIGDRMEACAVMLLFAVGEMLEERATKRSERSIEALLKMKPKHAQRLLSSGETESVLPETLAVGDTVVVRAGDAVPCDGTVVSGEASADTSSLTGESTPVSVSVGDTVMCGYIPLDGVLHINVTASYEDNSYSKILRAMNESREKRSHSEAFVERFARIYTPIVIALSILIMLIGSLITKEYATWIYRGLVFLAVSCPCAFVISVPLSFFFGIGEMSKHGFLIKGADCVEKMAGIRAAAFDKTGTVTKGEMRIKDVVVQNGFSEDELLRLCGALEHCSSHPVAAEIVACAEQKHVEIPSAQNVREIAGRGITGQVEGHTVSIGNRRLMDASGILIDQNGENGLCLYVSIDDAYVGYFVLQDEKRQGSAEAIRDLKAQGVETVVMLTGDSGSGAYDIARALGFDEAYIGLLPLEKTERLKALSSEDRSVAFVGDGINDAPVLASADVGVAMGNSGSSLAVETADAVILRDSLTAFSEAHAASKAVMRRVRFNVTFAIVLKAVVMLLSLFGLANMWLAVFGDVGVMLLVILNSIRPLYHK